MTRIPDKIFHIFLALALVLTPMQGIYANQEAHCDMQNMSSPMDEAKEMSQATQVHDDHCQHSSLENCYCDMSGCHCVVVSHVYIQTTLITHARSEFKNATFDTYAAQQLYIYLPSELRPPIA